MIRAVLDANVFISAILSEKGIPGKILRAWGDERFHLVTSEAILNEIARVLRYPNIARRHRWSETQLQAFLEDVQNLAILTPGQLTLSVIELDPSDNRYLECAVEGEASYIVTGDRHLLDLTQHQGIEILTPRAFIELLGGRPS